MSAGSPQNFLSLENLRLAGYVLSYPLIRTAKSLYNVLTNYKVLRSLFHLGAMAGVGFLTFTSTSGESVRYLSELLGNPGGISLAVGIAVTYVAVLATAFAAKYIAKSLSAFFYGEALNPTNPDKYQLSSVQKYFLNDTAGFINKAETLNETRTLEVDHGAIKAEMKAIHEKKDTDRTEKAHAVRSVCFKLWDEGFLDNNDERKNKYQMIDAALEQKIPGTNKPLFKVK